MEWLCECFLSHPADRTPEAAATVLKYIESIKKVDESGRWALDYIQARLYQASELIPLDDQMGMGVSPEQNVAYMAEPQKKQFPSGSHLALHDPNSRKSFRVLGLPGKMATFSTGCALLVIRGELKVRTVDPKSYKGSLTEYIDIGTYGNGKIIRFDDIAAVCDIQECQVIATTDSVVVPLSEELYFTIWGSHFDCSVQAVAPLLREAPGFRHLKSESLNRILHRASLVKICSNRIVFREGDRIDSEDLGANYYLLVAGSIRVVKKLSFEDPNKPTIYKDVAIDKLQPGEGFGAKEFILRLPLDVTLVTVLPVRLLQIPLTVIRREFSYDDLDDMISNLKIYPSVEQLSQLFTQVNKIKEQFGSIPSRTEMQLERHSQPIKPGGQMQVIDTLSQSIKQSTVRDPHNEPRSKVFTNKLVAEYASESMVPITLPKPKKAPQKKSLLAALVAQHLKEVNPNQAKPGHDPCSLLKPSPSGDKPLFVEKKYGLRSLDNSKMVREVTQGNRDKNQPHELRKKPAYPESRKGSLSKKSAKSSLAELPYSSRAGGNSSDHHSLPELPAIPHISSIGKRSIHEIKQSLKESSTLPLFKHAQSDPERIQQAISQSDKVLKLLTLVKDTHHIY